MPIYTTSITANGNTTPFDFQGGKAATIATGNFDNGGKLQLQYSLDDTNYAPVGKESVLMQPGGFLFELPACKMRWNLSEATTTVSITASVETI